MTLARHKKLLDETLPKFMDEVSDRLEALEKKKEKAAPKKKAEKKDE